MIIDMEATKELDPTVTKLFPKEKKLNISLGFISQIYLKVSKSIIL